MFENGGGVTAAAAAILSKFGPMILINLSTLRSPFEKVKKQTNEAGKNHEAMETRILKCLSEMTMSGGCGTVSHNERRSSIFNLLQMQETTIITECPGRK